MNPEIFDLKGAAAYLGVRPLQLRTIAKQGRITYSRIDRLHWRFTKRDLDAYIARQLYFIGTSGSTLEDMKLVLRKVVSRQLDTNLSVGELAEELRPLAGTRSDTVARILNRTRSNYERLLREAGATPHLLQGKARMLNSFSDLYLRAGNSRAAHAAAAEARGLFARLLDEGRPGEDEESPEETRRRREGGLADSLALAQQLDGIPLRFTGPDLPGAVAGFVKEYGITHVVVGRSRRPWWRQFFGPSLLDRLVRAVPGVDIVVVDTTPE